MLFFSYCNECLGFILLLPKKSIFSLINSNWPNSCSHKHRRCSSCKTKTLNFKITLQPFLDYIMPWGRPKWTWYAIVLLVFAVFDTSWVAYATGAQQKFKEPLLKYLAFPFIFGSTALILLFFLYSEYVGLPTMVDKASFKVKLR